MRGDAGAGAIGVFLDRDGTIIRDRHYLGSPVGVELLPGAAAAIARLNRAELPVVLVTNQSGIARGRFTDEDFQRVQKRLEMLLAAEGARLDAVYYCPHGPDTHPACTCRKPLPGLFEEAAAEHGLDLSRSFYVGDRIRDLIAGLEAGGRAMLVRAADSADHEALPTSPHAGRLSEVPSLAAAVDLILAELADD